MNIDLLLRLLDGYHAARVLVVGDVMLDRFIYGSVERISPEAPIPIVNVEHSLDVPGGAANVARNIAALGARATLLGVIGADSAADDLGRQWTAAPSIEVCLIVDSSRPTSVKTRYVADGQQVMRADRESCAPIRDAVAEQLLDQYHALLHAVDVVVLSDYAKGVLSDDVLRVTIEAARAHGTPLLVDPKSKDFGRYRGASMLTPNRLELQSAVSRPCVTDEQVAHAARQIIDAGICDTLVVTRGKDGMSIVEGQSELVHLPTEARQVFDVSGAGDTVVAAIALGLAAGGGVIEAATLANVAAGIVVGKRGTATVSPGELVATLVPFSDSRESRKIYALESVMHLVRSWREQGLRIAFANGCFDLLHPGHISLLEQARRSADRLVVGLNSDLSVRRLKGADRPVQSEVARATVLAAVKAVDAVVIFGSDTPLELIEALEPDVLVKGEDYTVDRVVGADLVLQRGGKVLLARLVPGHSTTETVKRVAASGAGRVVVLDRDGTLVIDRHYLDDPNGLEFESGAIEGLRLLHRHGYRLLVITNQSGVGRGLFSLDRVEAMNRRLHDMMKEIGVPLEGIYFCPHAPGDQCSCRKPAQGLLLRAASELHFDPATAIVVGDQESDVEFGRRAGAATVLLSRAPPREGSGKAPDFIAPDLLAAARAIVAGVVTRHANNSTPGIADAS